MGVCLSINKCCSATPNKNSVRCVYVCVNFFSGELALKLRICKSKILPLRPLRYALTPDLKQRFVALVCIVT